MATPAAVGGLFTGARALPGRSAWFLVLGLVGAAGYLGLPDGRLASMAFPVFPAAAVTAILFALHRLEAARRGPWLAIAAGLGLFVVGDVLYTLVPRGAPAFPSLADVAYLAAYPFLLAGAFGLAVRFRKGEITPYLDAMIIAIAAGVLLWTVLIDPDAALTGSSPTIEQMLAVTYPVLAVVIATIILPHLLVRETRSMAALLLVAGFGLVAISDARYGVEALAGTFTAGLPWDIGWVVGYVLIGAGSLHPSARSIGAVSVPVSPTRDLVRSVGVSLALLVVPGVLLLRAAASPGGQPVVLPSASVVIAGLVILRMQRTVAELLSAEARFRRFMNREGVIAGIKDHDGRYTYLNERAIELAGLRDREWVGKTDEELFTVDVAAWYRRQDDAVRRTGQTHVSSHEVGGRHWHAEKFRMPGNGGSIGVLQIDITERVATERALRARQELLARAEATAHIGSWELDPASGEATLSDELCRILGVDIGTELSVAAFTELIHPQDRERFHATVRPAIDAGRSAEVDVRIVRPGSGDERHVRVYGSARLAEGGSLRYVSVLQDVTDERAADDRIRMLDAAMAQASDAVIVTDREQRVVYVNPAFERVSGLRAADAVGHIRRDRVGKSSSTFARALAHVVRHGRPWSGDVVDRHADGTTITSATTISPLYGATGDVTGHVTIKRDVTRERLAEEASERRARERALVAETLASLRAGRSPEETAAEICHQVLKVPEASMASVVVFGDDGVATIIGQVNGVGTERMEIRLPQGRSDYLRERATVGPWVERWIENPEHPYNAAIVELGITAHAYAPLRAEGEPLGALIVGSNVPDAMTQLAERLPAIVEYGAIAGTLLAEPLEARMAVARSERVIRDAISARAFKTVFQPIVDLAGGAVRGFEALTRFDDGRAPDEWFAEARELGLGLELEAACLRGAMSASLELPDDVWLNVNVSPELMTSGRLDALLPRIPRELVLEITEHAAITDYVAFRAAVARLDGRIRLAVDDAGAGFASLRHIVELGPWLVKLDRSLVAGIDSDPARQAVVAGMAHFAATAGLVLVGEGIETDAELATLRSLGIDLGQGYLIGRPAPAPACSDDAVAA